MKSDLPNSSQFSPTQTPLPELLAIVHTYQDDRGEIEQKIEEAFFTDRNQPQLAKNTTIAMSEYQLVDRPRSETTVLVLTDLGELLHSLFQQGKDSEAYSKFATHILLNLRGLDLITCAQDVAASGVVPTKQILVRELKERGIYHPPNGTHANGMRQWFEKAGLVAKNSWIAIPEVLEKLLGGTSMEEIEQYSNLSKEQRDFARAFARLNVEEERSNRVARYATSLYGTEFAEGGLPQSVLFALQDAGLLVAEKTTSGQGAKPYIVRPTEKLKGEFLEPILQALEDSIGVKYRTLVRMQLPEILSDLRTKDTHKKGIALEALAFYLARLLRLRFVQWRLRGQKSGGAEVDVVMEGAHLIFSRWQIQCKNSKQATLDDIAKEVGLAQVIKSSVILIVTTGRIGPVARQFADQVMRDTNLFIAMLDGNDLQRLEESPSEIATILSGQAEGAIALKRSQVES